MNIEIYPFGGITKIDKHLNDHIYCDLLIAIFGVVFQLILFVLSLSGIITSAVFHKYNINIMLFNLLPIIPLDGSKIMFEFLNLFMPYKKALNIYPFISLVFVIVYVLFNYHYQLNNYLIITLFIFKTYQCFKDKALIHRKFLLERMLYDLKFSYVSNNEPSVNNYYKDVKNYYQIGNKKIDEKDYLKGLYKT